MKWLGSLFSSKPTKSVMPENTAQYPITYDIGWEIYTTTGTRFSRRYEKVKEKDSIKTVDKIKKEVSQMHVELERAAKEGNVFVNLDGTVIRVAEVSKIATFYHQSK